MRPPASIVPRASNTSADEEVAVHDDPLLSRLLRNRGMTDPSELEFSLRDLPAPDDLRDITLASERIANAVMQDERIVIVGDYDCDGATSTALAVTALQAMGAQHVDYMLPSRFIHGYGLSPKIVELASELQPDLLITVDNGIASVDGVEEARSRGIDVVVTDHHLPPAKLPEAIALINPNMPGSTFPSTHIAGVGVIFFVLAAVRRELSARDWFISKEIPEPKLAEYLDLVAVGTVADVVPLDRVNRALVMQGIRRIRAGYCRPGILALLERAGKDHTELVTEDIGFGIGPRLNAAGRLEDMRVGVECLLANDAEQACSLAQGLEQLNQERRRIGSDMADDASKLLQAVDGQLPQTDDVMSVCLYEKHWHEGVMGILAGRLKEQFGVPAIIFAPTGADKEATPAATRIKGSARSIPDYHILDALKRIRNRHPSILEKFGGHAMAAGLELDERDYATFRQAFDADVREYFSNRKPPQVLVSDGPLSPADFTVEKALLLRDLAPWGQAFPAPLFDNYFTVQSVRILKDRHLKLELGLLEAPGHEGCDATHPEAFGQVVNGLDRLPAIRFNELDPGEPSPVNEGDIVHVAFEPKPNHFNRQPTLQLQLHSIEVVGGAAGTPG